MIAGVIARERGIRVGAAATIAVPFLVVVGLVLRGEGFAGEDGTGGLPVGPVEAGGTGEGGGVGTVHGSDG